jgi:hypothetical protein
VGVISIDTPLVVVDSGSTIQIKATVRNFGDTLEDFNVITSFAGFIDTVLVQNLSPGATDQVSFSPFSVDTTCNAFYDLTVWTILTLDINFDNDTLFQSIYVSCPSVEGHDVGVVSVNAPAIIDTNSTLQVLATVRNFGDTLEDFNVIATFVGFTDSVLVQNLAPGDTDQVSFAPWIINTQCDTSFPLMVWTDLATDTIFSNDTLTQNIYIRCITHDVSVVSIEEPSSVENAGDTVQVRAIVKNLGDTTETFTVTYSVDTLTDSETVTALAKDDTISVTFSVPWPIPVVPCDTSYVLTVATQLPTDIISSNDTLTKNVFSLCTVHDIGVISIDQPSTIVNAGDTVAVLATVKNFGSATETFDVLYSVFGMTDTQTVSNLMPGDSVQITTFSPWPVTAFPCDTSFTLLVSSLLASDVFPSNDTRTKNIYSECPPAAGRDVGVVSIDEPPAIVKAGGIVQVIATVENFGDSTETFNVHYTINSAAVDTEQVSNLLPGATTQVIFSAPWSVPLAPCDTTYVLQVTSLLADSIPGNNTLTLNIYVECPPGAIHNVGVSSILAPLDTVAAGDSITPAISVVNSGDGQETFDVSIIIGSGYADTVSGITMDAGSTAVVSFKNWQVDTLCPASYVVAATAVLPSDTFPANDIIIKTVLAECPGLPGSFSLLSPQVNSVLISDIVTFLWQSSNNANQYRLLVASDTTFLSPSLIIDTTIIDTSITLTLQDNSSNYWKVEAISGIFSRPSLETFKFSIIIRNELVTLFLNFPNPADISGTTIKYALSRAANVTIRLYDVSGQMVFQFLKDEPKAKGVYFVTWQGQDHGGNELANGVYLCEVTAKATSGGDEEKKFRRIAVYRN